jgi:hypothetical protein
MATPDEIRRLEYAVREAQANLDRARAENQRADEAWERMVVQAEQSLAQGKSVSAAFICGSAERARRFGADATPRDKIRGGNLTRNLMVVPKDKFK